ncbi:MAG: VTT domain-containing protein [Chlamydiae bacterium]|nr:VTT domain-containing protein [Chlamydiota bacterium]
MKKFIKYLPIGFILIATAIAYFTGMYKYFSFENVKEHHKLIKAFTTAHPFLTPILYMLVYSICSALAVPGKVFLSIFGGYLFPQPLSTIYVVFSATCGATAVHLAALTALGDLLRKKTAPFLKKMKSGFQKNAVSYLLFLRFVIIFPFWIVNIASAFFGVPVRTFVWTTLVGITPGSFAFTLAGRGLEKIFESEQPFSIAAIFNIQLKIALILLGILALVPIIIKRIKKS